MAGIRCYYHSQAFGLLLLTDSEVNSCAVSHSCYERAHTVSENLTGWGHPEKGEVRLVSVSCACACLPWKLKCITVCHGCGVGVMESELAGILGGVGVSKNVLALILTLIYVVHSSCKVS
jgi:hypothetical protein